MTPQTELFRYIDFLLLHKTDLSFAEMVEQAKQYVNTIFAD